MHLSIGLCFFRRRLPKAKPEAGFTRRLLFLFSLTCYSDHLGVLILGMDLLHSTAFEQETLFSPQTTRLFGSYFARVPAKKFEDLLSGECKQPAAWMLTSLGRDFNLQAAVCQCCPFDVSDKRNPPTRVSSHIFEIVDAASIHQIPG